MKSNKIKLKNSQIFKAFWIGLKPYSWPFLFVLAAVTLASILTVIVPIFYKNFFDIVASATDKNIAGQMLLGIITTIAVIHFFQWVFYRTAMFTNNFVESQTMAKLRQDAFNYLALHSHSFFADNFTGSLVQKVGRFSRAFEKIADTIIFQLIPLIVMVFGSVIVTFTVAPIISLVIALWVAFFFLFNFFYSKKVMVYSVDAAAADSKTGAVLADAIGNHSAITNFTGYEYEKESFYAVTEEQAQKTRKSWNMREISMTLQASLLFIVEFVVFYYAIIFWQRGAITIGTFVLVQIYIIGVANELWGLSRIIRNFYEAISDSKEMVEIMVLPYEINDVVGARDLEIKSGAGQGSILLRDVSFVYTSTQNNILRGINLAIASGEKVALIGPSGAGKTTLTRLILRLHDVSGGAIFIDGQDIGRVTQESLRKNISLVPQDPVLFHRSLLENIRYGRRDATDEEVFAASKLAHCDEFIDTLPNKYETLVGERGVKLSGGERQRIAIARAILKNAPILILDEATSSLDSHSEFLIQEALDVLMKGRTTIVIAHRLSTIRKMDRIIVMENGLIREEGTHADLLKDESSLYKKLWDLQAGGFIAM